MTRAARGSRSRGTAGLALRALRALGTVAAVAAGVAGCDRGRVRFSDADRAALEAVIAAQRDAWNRGDIAGFMDGYARDPGIVFTSGGNIRTGWDTTRAHFERRYGASRAEMGTLGLDILEVRAVGADGAVVLGRWSVTGTPVGGAGVFTLVMERRREGWRIVHDHTSTAPGDAAAPAE